MDQHVMTSSLADLAGILSSGALAPVLAVLTDRLAVVDGDGKLVAATATFPRAILDDPILAEGVKPVLANRQDSFVWVHQEEAGAWARYRVLPLRAATAPERPVLGALIVRHDLTEVMRADQRLADGVKRLAMLVHDLRGELNAVIGFSELMLRETWGPMGDSRYPGYARMIHQSGNQLLHQVNQIMDLSRAGLDGLTMEETEVDLDGLLRDCCLNISPLADCNGLTVTLDRPGAAPVIRADPRLTRRVALNLLGNAVKFTPPGGTVTASLGLDELGHPFLAIRDTGIGIAADQLKRVMEPFAQAPPPHHAPQGSTHQGLGLGLSLSLRFMELHDGSLHLDSAPQRGTVVTARFPPARLIRVQPPG